MTSPAEMTPAGDSRRARGLQLAADALRSAMREDHTRAARAVQALSDELGGEGVMLAIHAWTDTLVDAYRQVTGTPDDAPVRPGWVNAQSGEIATDAGDVPVEVRWAGRFIAARAAMDLPSCHALLGALPDDGDAIGRHVAALLNIAGLTLWSLKRRQP